jgi:hypothetical protein
LSEGGSDLDVTAGEFETHISSQRSALSSRLPPMTAEG